MDLATRLLNHERAISELLSAPTTDRKGETRQRRQERLTSGEIEQLVERYHDGESTRELAAGSAAHRHTITSALARAGVELRHNRRRLTDELVHQAATLYGQGWTLARLADDLGVGRETIRRELLKSGVQLRPRGGPH